MFLEKILIKNSPAFESVNIAPSKGLNIISGASGSGKSVFFGSLLALFGIKESNAGVIEAEIGGEIDLRENPQEEEVLVQILKKARLAIISMNNLAPKKDSMKFFLPILNSSLTKTPMSLAVNICLKFWTL